MFKSWILKLNQRQSASVFLVMLATVVFGFLMAIAYSIRLLEITDAEQVRDQTIELKLKLLNEAALSEAISTRFYPTSNRLAWNFNSEEEIATLQDPVSNPDPFLHSSNYIYETVNGIRKVVGRYQYVILGVNPYLDYNAGTGTYTFDSTKVESGTYLFNINNPIYVATRSFVCVDRESYSIAYNAVLPDGGSPYFATCANPLTQKLLVKLKFYNFQITGTTSENSTTNLIESQILPPSQTITTKEPFLNKDATPTHTFNFDEWWSNTGVHQNATSGGLTPIAYAYLNKNTGAYVYTNWPNPATTTINLPNQAKIPYFKMIFNGSIDERSLYTVYRSAPYNRSFYFPQSAVYMNTPTADQINFPNNQHLYSATILRKNTTLANDENSLSQTVLYPGANMLEIEGDSPCDTANNIVINHKQQLRDTDGFKNTNVYTIHFANNSGC